MTNKRALAPWKESYDKSWQHIKKQRHHFANKGPYHWSYSFSSSHVWMWKLVHKEGWELKNLYFWIVVLEKTLGSPLDCKEIKPVNPKVNQPWKLIGRTDAEAPILWPPDAKNWLIGKDPDAGKDWGQKEKGVTEDEMVGWHHGLNEHEFEQTLGDCERQGSLSCCSPCGHKVRHGIATEQHPTISLIYLNYYVISLDTLRFLMYNIISSANNDGFIFCFYSIFILSNKISSLENCSIWNII